MAACERLLRHAPTKAARAVTQMPERLARTGTTEACIANLPISPPAIKLETNRKTTMRRLRATAL